MRAIDDVPESSDVADALRPRPIWTEALTVPELLVTVPGAAVAALAAPPGGVRPVLVLPGFVTGDITTAPLRAFLRSLGHRPFGWGLGLNVVVADHIAGGLDDINASMSELTLELDPQPAQAISNRVSAPSVLAGAAARLLLTTGAGLRMMPPFDVYIVSIPGQDEGLIAGHDILREHAMVPITDGCGLSISAISHDHRVDITLVADPDMVADLDVLAERLEIELDLLHHECATLAAS